MSSETMKSIMQEVTALTSRLTSNEKLTLAAFLVAQAKQDAVAEANGAMPKAEAAETNEQAQTSSDAVPDRSFRREYEWLSQHRHEYPGQYLLVEGNQLVSHGADLRQALAEARQAGAKYPLLVRVDELQ